jgi:hypothetical protein
MGKRIYWVLLALVTLTGLGTMIYYGIQPRPIPKIKLSRFESPTVLANSILLRLREEIQQSPVLFLGVDVDRPEHFAIWKEFLAHNQEPGSKYDLVVMDQLIQNNDIPEAQKIPTKDDFEVFYQGVQQALASGKRIAIIVPTVYSVQMIPGNLVQNYKAKAAVPPMSLSLSDFPRHRETELKELTNRCVVEGVDQTGVGPFGCLVLQTARGNYRQHFHAGDWIGLVNQIGLKDYLVLYTQEK